MRMVRRAIPAEPRAQRSNALCERVLGLDEYARAQVIAGYVAVKSEADPAGVLAHALRAGKVVALPRVAHDGELVLHAWAHGDPLHESDLGIPEPSAEAPRVVPERVDLVLVPALGADPRGHRLGSGRGFYDRLLPSLTRAHKLAFVFDFQLLAELPDTAGDERVDGVVTDRRTLRTNAPEA